MNIQELRPQAPKNAALRKEVGGYPDSKLPAEIAAVFFGVPVLGGLQSLIRERAAERKEASVPQKSPVE